MTVVWEDFSRKVFKEKSHSSGFKYWIWDDNTNEEIILYLEDMLAMCRAVIEDAERELTDDMD